MSFLYFHFYFFAELFFANLILVSLSYGATHEGLRSFSQPTIFVATTSFIIFSLFFISSRLKHSIILLSYTLFFCASRAFFFSLCFKSVALLAVTFLVFVSKRYLSARNVLRYEYDIFFSFAIFGLFLVASFNDFLPVYLAVETQGLCFYLLAAFQRHSEFSA